MKKVVFLFIVGFLILAVGFFTFYQNKVEFETRYGFDDTQDEDGGPSSDIHPLSIDSLRNSEFYGSDIAIEQTLASGSNYGRYIASYKSEGLKIYALLTVPNGNKPENGFPVIIFNHGFIPPDEYRTTERYIAYTDAFSRNGYIVFRPDYRGHGNSEGQAGGGYSTNEYTIDVLNALSSIKKYKDANPEKIGMWGHSMGGHITLRSMVVSKEIKAGVIWAGVVGPYPDLFLRNQGSSLNPEVTPRPTNTVQTTRGRWRTELINKYGTYEQNKEFWDKLSSVSYADELSGPVQFHHGTNDTSVPVGVSKYVEPILAKYGKSGGIYIYQGDDHDITNNFGVAIVRSVEFFDQYLK